MGEIIYTMMSVCWLTGPKCTQHSGTPLRWQSSCNITICNLLSWDRGRKLCFKESTFRKSFFSTPIANSRKDKYGNLVHILQTRSAHHSNWSISCWFPASQSCACVLFCSVVYLSSYVKDSLGLGSSAQNLLYVCSYLYIKHETVNVTKCWFMVAIKSAFWHRCNLF